MSWLENLMRPDLRGMNSYSSARTESEGQAAIALDANESPWPPFGRWGATCDANRYPEPQPTALRQRLAAVYGVKPQQLLLGRGSDEGIDLLIRLFCRAGTDEILLCPPTFGMYEVYATVQGAKTIKVPLCTDQGWSLDVPVILAACTTKTKLIFIPAPNAPMGHPMARKDLLALCRARAEQSLIVIDEAYVEFAESPEGLIAELNIFSNLVILRTLSKAHALAGERIGATLGAPALIAALQKIQAPYPLPQSSLRVALEALSPNGLIQSAERRRLLVAERERLAQLLPQSLYVTHVFPSSANFLLIETKDADALMSLLMRLGLRLRNRSKDLPNTVRISIGTPEENDTLLRALDVTLPASTQNPRLTSLRRTTKETQIDVTVDLDAPHFLDVQTGLGFFDHMLSQLAIHGSFGLALNCDGDLNVDQHHTIEDCALALGEALKAALGDKRGVGRFGFTTPLDEALAEAIIDLSGRPYAAFEGTPLSSTVGEMDTEMVPHFFRSLATSLGAAIHITVKGENTHHMIEASFKALGRALRQALKQEGKSLPSTKGFL